MLKKAIKLIEKGWCQGAEARTKTGKPTSLRSKHATQYCLVGALEKCGLTDLCSSLNAEMFGACGKTLAEWNDSVTKEQVLELLRSKLS